MTPDSITHWGWGIVQKRRLDPTQLSCSGGGLMPPSGQASSSSIISAWDKRTEWRIPLWGLRMEISLIYSSGLPQAFCHRLFVYCLQLRSQGVGSPWQSLNRLHYSGPCPSCQPPAIEKGERDSGLGTWHTGHLPQSLQLPHRRLSPSSRTERKEQRNPPA